MTWPETFWFLRHGETDWNRQNLCLGQRDIPLNDRGRAQATAAVDQVRAIQPDRIITSPLSRARDTAQMIARALGLDLVLEPRLKEAGLGDYEGEVEEDMAVYTAWMGGTPPRGGEAFSALCTRTRAAVLEGLSAGDKPLFVGHTGVAWSLFHLAGTPAVADLPHATPLRIKTPQ